MATPFYLDIIVDEGETDHLRHVNNTVYLQYMERAAWAHTQALALTWQDYVRMDTALVVRHHDLTYLKAVYAREHLRVATWVIDNDQRLNIWRGFQIWRLQTGKWFSRLVRIMS